MFTEAIEEKRRYQEQLREVEEFQDKNLEIYNAAKQEIQKILKEKEVKKKDERCRRRELMGNEIPLSRV